MLKADHAKASPMDWILQTPMLSTRKKEYAK
jgi:hypothetical protein